MKFSRFQQKIQRILAAELPPGGSVLKQGLALARDVRIGRSAFMDKMGVASELEYAKRLKTELNELKIDLPVVMGGILNQKVEDAALPVDVTSDLKALGFYASRRLEGRFRKLLEHNTILKKK